MTREETREKEANYGERTAVADVTAEITDTEPDLMDIEVKNPRIGRVRRLKEEAEREREIERQRSRRIRQEQEYIDQMSLVVDEHLRNTKEEQKYNEEFEEHIRGEVYRMHGISEDKLQGMNEYRRAWYQGAAFALFFLSLLLYALCGVLHGFGSELAVFVALYTALEGALLTNGRKRSVCMTIFTRVIYLCLFPVMMVVFVCYELGFEEYSLLVPVLTVAAVVVLMIGSVSYFLYDPYRADRRSRKKANRYLRDMEKAAQKEVRLKEKAYGKQEKRRAAQKAREEKRAEKQAAREEKRAAKQEACEEKRAAKQEARGEKRAAKQEARGEKRAAVRETFAGKWAAIQEAREEKRAAKKGVQEEKREAGEETRDEMRGTESPPQEEPMNVAGEVIRVTESENGSSVRAGAGVGGGSSEEAASEPKPRVPAEAVARTDPESSEEELETGIHTSVGSPVTELPAE